MKSSDNTFFALSYLIFAMPLVIFLAIKMPPFQVADGTDKGEQIKGSGLIDGIES